VSAGAESAAMNERKMPSASEVARARERVRERLVSRSCQRGVQAPLLPDTCSYLDKKAGPCRAQPSVTLSNTVEGWQRFFCPFHARDWWEWAREVAPWRDAFESGRYLLSPPPEEWE